MAKNDQIRVSVDFSWKPSLRGVFEVGFRKDFADWGKISIEDDENDIFSFVINDVTEREIKNLMPEQWVEFFIDFAEEFNEGELIVSWLPYKNAVNDARSFTISEGHVENVMKLGWS
jgi:hypothetical protein